MADIIHTSTGASNTSKVLSVTGNIYSIPDIAKLFALFDERGVTFDVNTKAVTEWANQVSGALMAKLLPSAVISETWAYPVYYLGEQLAGYTSLKYAPTGYYNQSGLTGYRSCYMRHTGSSPISGTTTVLTQAYLVKIKPSYQPTVNGSYQYGGGSHSLGRVDYVTPSNGGSCGLGVRGADGYGDASTKKWSWTTWNNGVEYLDGNTTIPIHDEWVLYIITSEYYAANNVRRVMYEWDVLKYQDTVAIAGTYMNLTNFYIGSSANRVTVPFADIMACYAWESLLDQSDITNFVGYIKTKYGLS